MTLSLLPLFTLWLYVSLRRLFTFHYQLHRLERQPSRSTTHALFFADFSRIFVLWFADFCEKFVCGFFSHNYGEFDLFAIKRYSYIMQTLNIMHDERSFAMYTHKIKEYNTSWTFSTRSNFFSRSWYLNFKEHIYIFVYTKVYKM